MLKANKYRLYPSDSQKELLEKHFGCVRFVYNLALETKTWAYSAHGANLSRYDLQKQLTDLKKGCAWLRDVNSQSLQCALLNLDMAYTNFLKGRAGFPNFKKRSNSQSFHCPQAVSVSENRLLVPKFKGGIKIVLHRQLQGKIRSATVSKTPTGKYFVSILVETGVKMPVKKPVEKQTAIGISCVTKKDALDAMDKYAEQEVKSFLGYLIPALPEKAIEEIYGWYKDHQKAK